MSSAHCSNDEKCPSRFSKLAEEGTDITEIVRAPKQNLVVYHR